MGITTYPLQGNIGSSLLPQRYDIQIYQGDTFEVLVRLKDASNALINLTGFTGLVQFRNDAGVIVASPVVSVNDGGNFGDVRVTLLDTSTLAEGTFTWDLQLTDPAGRRRTYLGGRVIVTQDVSE